MSEDEARGHDPESAPSSGDQMVPYWRFKEVIDEKNSFKNQAEEYKSRLAQRTDSAVGHREQQQPEKPKPSLEEFRQELRQQVSDGRITEADAATKLDEFVINEATARATEQALNQFQQANVSNTQQERFNAFRQRHPDAFVEGTQERARVERKYQELLSLGAPADHSTELIALQNAFGDPSVDPSGAGPESFLGGTAAQGDGNVPSPGGVPSDLGEKLTDRQKGYYKSQVEAGHYSWDDVREEVKAMPESSKRLARSAQAVWGS